MQVGVPVEDRFGAARHGRELKRSLGRTRWGLRRRRLCHGYERRVPGSALWQQAARAQDLAAEF